MRRIGFWRTLALLVGLSTGLVACGDDPVQPATGALQVDVVGLPAGTNAQITVEGPGGFTRQLTQSQTLSALSVGSYTVSAGEVLGFVAQVSGFARDRERRGRLCWSGSLTRLRMAPTVPVRGAASPERSASSEPQRPLYRMHPSYRVR